jgi:uncharacterized lipoprotein YehR (DUF1307 family)
MKKKLALLFALVMVCATMLTACGGGSKLADTTWTLTSVSVDDVEVTAEQMDETFGESIITFEDNSVCKANFGGSEGEGTWKLDGDKVTITIDEEDMEAVLSDSELVMDLYGTKMTFTKK